MIQAEISDAYAEYLRIQLMRAKDTKEVERLRNELHTIEEQLYKQHKQMVARMRKC
jgi:hypothetical protein